MAVQDRDEAPKRRASDEPLEVRSTRMVVGAVQARTRHDLEEPSEEGLVAGMHPHRDGRLPAVAPEAALTDEHPEKEAGLQVFHDSPPVTCRSCYTVW